MKDPAARIADLEEVLALLLWADTHGGPSPDHKERAWAVLRGESPHPVNWTCDHGVTHTGSEDFVSGARMAHEELRVPYAQLLSALSQLITDAVGALADPTDAEGWEFLRDVAVPRARETLNRYEIPLADSESFDYITGRKSA